ncbi:hypothetical protein N802_01815 [Knoellia sinensis KCTC 19936]|uniref:AB hydrolase-1 domain-containing protein n=1 Tax=Knoellia sinensis KCTC 19936 TaxID=1385520 RepID=A0A0A0JCA8_9MICO|nr:alpha/beta hydrolase [Knoellia sinensis]KGN34813.1 hypothetical protein N802_01815 [Knoellia sinensis KCTC 19936]
MPAWPESILLLPSPLVGVHAYAVLAEAFRACGRFSEIAEPPSQVTTGVQVREAFRRAVLRMSPDLVVAHSNAGLVAPAVADGIPVVFVDAALPPTVGQTTMAPPALHDSIAGLADSSGLLPPWTQWWPEDDVAALFPDSQVRASIESQEPRLPLSYFRTTVGAPARWEARPCAYLAFGETYAREQARARRLGWPVAVLDDALHLHHLHEPTGVAERVLELARRLNATEAHHE